MHLNQSGSRVHIWQVLQPRVQEAFYGRGSSIFWEMPEHLMADAVVSSIGAFSGGSLSEQPLLPKRRRKALWERSFPAFP